MHQQQSSIKNLSIPDGEFRQYLQYHGVCSIAVKVPPLPIFRLGMHSILPIQLVCFVSCEKCPVRDFIATTRLLSQVENEHKVLLRGKFVKYCTFPAWYLLYLIDRKIGQISHPPTTTHCTYDRSPRNKRQNVNLVPQQSKYVPSLIPKQKYPLRFPKSKMNF